MKEIKGFNNVRASFRTKQVKFGGYAALLTLALIVGLILVNLIIGQFPLQLDMTESGLFSLSEQTVQVLDQIKTPVNIYGLWQPGQENTDVTEVLDLYLARNKNLRYQALDPNKNPGFVMKYDKNRQGISQGSVIVEGEKGFRVIPVSDWYDYSNYNNQRSLSGISVERRLTSALLYVGTGNTPAVYEIAGHDETTLTSRAMQDTIERENYTLKQLNLIQADIPQDASALIINAPKSDISRGEADKILTYLEGGGRLFVLADFRVQNLSTLNEVLASYGLGFDYGVVMENDLNYRISTGQGDDLFLEVPDMEDHEIVKSISEKQNPVIISYSMGVSELEMKRRSIGLFPLLKTSKNSWLRTDLQSNSTARISSDRAGPVTLAMAVMDPQYIQGNEKQTRIVAAGAGTLLDPIGYYGQNPPNLDFFMNSLTWLEDRPEALSVRSKSLFLLPMRINGLQLIIFAGFFTVLIPLAFFVSGLVIWLKRRHL